MDSWRVKLLDRQRFSRLQNKLSSFWTLWEHWFPERYRNASLWQTHTYKRRWIVLSAFFLLSLSNNLTQYSFAPIISQVKTFYSVDESWVNLLSIVYMVSGFTIRFVGMWVIDNHGLGLGIFLATVLNLVGCWIRFWGSTWKGGYQMLLIGQILCACAMAFLDISAPKVSANWFPPKERTIATAIASGPVFFGLLLGYVTAPLVVQNGEDLRAYMLYQAAPATACAFLIGAFFRGTPPVPPSTSAGAVKLSFFQAFLEVVQNRNFAIIFIVFSVAGGGAASFATLLDEILEPLYDTHKSDLVGVVWISTAIVWAGIASILVDRTHAYKVFVVTNMGLLVLAMAAFTAVLIWFPSHFIFVVLAGGSMGLGASGIPAIIETAIECTYPMPEGTVMGLLFLGFNITSIAFTEAMNVLLKKNRLGANYMVLGFYAISFLCVIFLKPDYRRLAYEKKKYHQSLVSEVAPGSHDTETREESDDRSETAPLIN